MPTDFVPPVIQTQAVQVAMSLDAKLAHGTSETRPVGRHQFEILPGFQDAESWDVEPPGSTSGLPP
jgi:hypothetical protein